MPGHIEGEDCREATGRGHGCGSPPWGDRSGFNYSTTPITRRNRLQSTGAAPVSFLISAIAFAGSRLSDKSGAVQDRVAAVGLTMLNDLRFAAVRQFIFYYQSYISA